MVLRRSQTVTEPATAGDTSTRSTGGGSFIKGCIVQGANPKALIFFTALLPQFLDPVAPLAWQVGILGVTSIAIELVVLTLYAAAAVQARRWAGPRFAGAIERVGGAFLVAVGARLAIVR